RWLGADSGVGELGRQPELWWYGAEGDVTNAAFSCGAAAPLAGIAATFTKWFRKGADAAGDVAGAGRRSGGGPPGCSSFVPGTGVLLADGRVKPVEEVEVGDRVWATDPETGEEGPRTVVATITSSGIKELVEVTVDVDGADGDKTARVVATAEHPFWVDDQGRWLNADELTPGDGLRSASGDHIEITAIRQYVEVRRVHNLTISGIRTYYLDATDSSLLVHNTGCAIWDDIKATGPVIPGSGGVPATFELSAGGTSVWVNSNATKHIIEKAKSVSERGMSPEYVALTTQQQLRSFQAAVGGAIKEGSVPLNQRITVGGWQLEFSQRAQDRLPVVIHARSVR
ncbi:Protein of unknown function (DUF1557), partial [Saccharomonospora azurea]